MKHSLALLTTLLLAPPAVLHAAELKFASVFADHAALQREAAVPVWGWADAGERVRVEFAGQMKTATADAGGKWRVALEPMQASAVGRELLVRTDIQNRRMKIADVLVGEVWLCAGQPNRAMTVDGKTGWLRIGGIANAKDVVRDSANPLLRQFLVEWKKVAIPASPAKLGCADGGVVWLRREIEVPADFGTAWRLDFPV